MGSYSFPSPKVPDNNSYLEGMEFKKRAACHRFGESATHQQAGTIKKEGVENDGSNETQHALEE